ncbi:S-layer homology domain-containing protein [Anoxybacteroides rupiense]|uniref:S-layer homology domain-containing protein n=1 Tax=Anoxybacteroides rupiense TaxID=311460 RepID=UPI003FA57B66
MAYQPKSYRKFLAGSVSAALVATAVGPVVASAASFSDVNPNDSHAANIEKLVEKGYIKGYEDGTFKPYNNVTRGQVAKIFARILKDNGFQVPADKKAFDDVPVDAKDQELVEAAAIVKAAGVMTGNEGKLNPNQTMTRQQMAKVLVEAFDLTKPADFTSKITDLDKADEWARDYIKTLEANGVTVVTEYNPKGTVTRAAFASFVVRALDAQEAAQAPKVVSVSAINAKTLKVALNKELTSLDGLTFTVKRGTTSVVLTAKLSEDKKSVELSSSTNLVPGDYTVTVTGGKFEEGKNTGTVTVEAQRIASIELKSTNLVLASGTTPTSGTVSYIVKDQYGTDVTKEAIAANITWTSSVGTASDDNQGVLTINKGSEIKVDDTVTVTGVDAATGKTVSATLKAVKAASLSSLTFGELKLPTNKTRVETGLATAADVLVDVKDQYGNTITDTTTIDNATQVVVSDPSVTTSWVTVDNKPALRLNTIGLSSAKKVTVTVVIRATGQTVQYTFDVVKPSEPAEVAATAPTTVIAAGDAAGTVVVPLTVKDQFGKELTLDEIAANAGGFTITSSNSSVLPSNALAIATTGDNKGKLVNTGAVAGTGKTVITITVNATGKSTSFELEAKAARQLTSVELPTDLATNLIQGSTTTTKLKYKDQYGADFDATGDVANHKIVLSVDKVSGDDAGLTVSPNGDVANESSLDTDDAITLTADATKKGSYTLTAKLVNTSTNEVVSQATKTINVVENSSSGITYSVEDIPTLYKAGADFGTANTVDNADVTAGYAKEIKITAKDANGNTYVIPSSAIVSVSVDNTNLADVAKIGTKYYIAAKDETITEDKTVTLTVVVNTKEGIQTINKQVKISKDALYATAVKLLDKPITDSTAKAVTSLTFNDIAAFRTGSTVYGYVVDQFGGTSLDFDANTTEYVTNVNGFTISSGDSVGLTGTTFGLTDADTSSTATAGATLRYVVVTNNGKTATIDVKVTN